MGRLDEASQLIGRDEGYVLGAAPMDDDDLAAVGGFVEKSFEVRAGVRVRRFGSHISPVQEYCTRDSLMRAS